VFVYVLKPLIVTSEISCSEYTCTFDNFLTASLIQPEQIYWHNVTLNYIVSNKIAPLRKVTSDKDYNWHNSRGQTVDNNSSIECRVSQPVVRTSGSERGSQG